MDKSKHSDKKSSTKSDKPSEKSTHHHKSSSDKSSRSEKPKPKPKEIKILNRGPCYLCEVCHAFLEVPDELRESVDAVLKEEMEKPITEMSMPASWNMGDYLSILTEPEGSSPGKVSRKFLILNFKFLMIFLRSS